MASKKTDDTQHQKLMKNYICHLHLWGNLQTQLSLPLPSMVTPQCAPWASQTSLGHIMHT